MRAWIGTILKGYAQVFFSTNPWTGLLFMLATFACPSQGAVGLLAMLLGNAIARLGGLQGELLDQGYFAFNCLLVGLVVGFTYRPDAHSLVFLVASVALCVALSSSLYTLFQRYLGTPPLCAPFVLTSWLILTAGTRFPGLTYTVAPYEIETLSGFFPQSAEFFFRSLGATFFQFNVPAGLLIALGLLIFSRHALLMAIVGLWAAGSLQSYLGYTGVSLLGFNAALTGIALGGVWVVPGPDSLILAAVSGALCAVVTVATQVLFDPLDLPVLAFPFLVTTTAILFALRQRTRVQPFAMVQVPAESPEANLKRKSDSRQRHLTGDHPVFFLPFRGEWKVTQGIEGEFTHCGQWRHAWDFEVVDQQGRAYRTTGQKPEDFLAFGMPACAAAPGRVVGLRGDLPDSPVGQVAAGENWGNHVILEHVGGVYSGVYHLTPGSLEVALGEQVRAGQVLGRVGSSGRSPVPHLHFQAQATPDPGAPTVAAEFLHYVLEGTEDREYCTRGQPQQGDRLRALIPDPQASCGVLFPLGQSWRFLVHSRGEEWTETWTSEVDFLGARSLVCEERGGRLELLVDRSSLLTWNQRSALPSALGWFGLGVPRLPSSRETLTWQDQLPADLLLGSTKRFFHDLVQPFATTAHLECRSRLTPTAGGECLVTTEIAPHGLLLGRHPGVTVSTRFGGNQGPLGIRVCQSKEVVLEARISQSGES